MSHFYGYLWGNRGTVTRQGSVKSGINTKIRSWDNEVVASLNSGSGGKDILNLSIPKGLKVIINNIEVDISFITKNYEDILKLVKIPSKI